MQTRRHNLFTTIRTEGAILPADLLQRVAEGDSGLEGLRPEDYHLSGEKLNEAVNRSWNRLLGAWRAFHTAREKLPQDDPATSVTREKWLLPLFRELDFGRLPSAKAVQIEDKSYPISHSWEQTPIHLLGWEIDLDRRTRGVAGAATTSPHSMVQEFLNRSDGHLWAFLSNGRTLRILRDNVSLTRQAYVEFDLQSMMDGEIYADFTLLWLLCHQSRVEAERPEQCRLEKWSQAAHQQGTRALDQLRGGVEQAIKALGRGFLVHPKNTELRDKLYTGALSAQDYYRQLLRMVYRLLFLFVAEDRGLLVDPSADERARERYTLYYSTARLRQLAERHRGTRHGDLFHGLILVMEKLGSDDGCPELGLPALGSFLWSNEAIADLAGTASGGDRAVKNDREQRPHSPLPTAHSPSSPTPPCSIANTDLLAAVRELAFTVDRNVLRVVDYKNLGAEELGSIYESLLELHPRINQDAGTFELGTAAGHERKTTGSYYTPTSLINCLLDSALDPVLDEAVKGGNGQRVVGRGETKTPYSPLPDGHSSSSTHSPLPTAHSPSSTPEQRILNLKICDPACGSGHFLIAAAHRIGKRLAAVRTGDDEPAPDALRHAIRDVIARCIFGVDVNPMAVELCKINLWLESLEPGKPLSFLDHHIQCGNSLLGTTPALLVKGIPDEAFKPIEGDDKTVCSEMKRLNRDERRGQKTFDFEGRGKPWERMGDLATSMAQLDEADDSTVADIRSKQERYEELVQSSGYLFGHFWADAWCAAFVWKKTKEFDYGITEELFRQIERNPHAIVPWMRDEIERLTKLYNFFHWHLAFPQVFRVPAEDEEPQNEQTGWSGGFDVVLGNPPWERIKIQEKEWFSQRAPEIANAKNAASRRKLIAGLRNNAPQLFRDFKDACRASEAQSHLFRVSGRYPMCGRGDINTYMIFSELNQSVIGPRGRAGFIVPSGIATDDTTKFFFQFLIRNGILVSLFDFRNKGFFGDVAGAQGNRIALVTLAGMHKPVSESRFMFRGESISDLSNVERVFTLNKQDVAAMNPNTLTCPVFQSQRDAEIVKRVYRSMPVLHRDTLNAPNKWTIRIRRVLDMNKSDVLAQCTAEPDGNSTDWVPVCESKMMHQFDAKFGTYEGVILTGKGVRQIPTPDSESRNNPRFQPKPRYWIRASDLLPRIADGFDGQWLLVWRDITSNVDFRTVIASVIPFMGTDFTLRMATVEPRSQVPCLVALLNSFAFDYVARQKLGGTHLSDYISFQLPVPSPDSLVEPPCWDRRASFQMWTGQRVLELTYTAWDLQAFALDCDYAGPAFRWDEERRFLLRCELDAAFFHLYLGPPAEWGVDSPQLREMFPTPRNAVDYIMETFPIVKRKDDKQHGEYRTKRVILEIYDAMQKAIDTGQPYRTRLDPPPGPPTDADGNFIPMGQWDPANWPPHIHPPREATKNK
jgi:hypothetical protein